MPKTKSTQKQAKAMTRMLPGEVLPLMREVGLRASISMSWGSQNELEREGRRLGMCLGAMIGFVRNIEYLLVWDLAPRNK